MFELKSAVPAISWRMWAILGRMMCLVPKTQNERALIDQLKSDFRLLPSLDPASESTSRQQWINNQMEMRRCIKKKDPRAFLTWRVIASTMFVPYARFTRHELALLQDEPDRDRWEKAIEERPAGFPFPCVGYRSSSANAIHHAYHLRSFELQTGMRIDTFSLIFEFGGGYGSTCRIARSVGFTGDYIIFDLPELSAIQRYYLATVSVEALTVSDPDKLSRLLAKNQGTRLFIATWSLSESPASVREQVLAHLREFDAFLIAYQQRFGENDNDSFFRRMSAQLPEVQWKVRPMVHLPQDRYMFGWKQPMVSPPLPSGESAGEMHRSA